MGGVEREVAVLFADVAGSTQLYERLGDAAALLALERCIGCLDAAIAAQRGRVVKTIGDEVMAVFSSAEAACRAAVEMQRRTAELPAVAAAKLAIRIGCHFGNAIEDHDDVFGDTVNTAARIVGLAKAGQILASRQTLDAIAPAQRPPARDLDQFAVKGKAVSVHLFELLWQENPELTTLTQIVTLPATARPCCAVSYRGRVWQLDVAQRLLTLGRQPGNDVVIADRKASRQHARIEWRGSKCVLVDQSTNGSFVWVDGESEVFLRHEELPLRGRGRIGFGSSLADPDADPVGFEYR